MIEQSLCYGTGSPASHKSSFPLLKNSRINLVCRIKTVLEKCSVITVEEVKDKYDAVVKAVLWKLPTKIDCLSLMKDDRPGGSKAKRLRPLQQQHKSASQKWKG